MNVVTRDRFWVAWWLGLASFVAGIALVGVIPGDQRVLGVVLAPTWLILVLVGLISAQHDQWPSPTTYWAIAFAVSCTIARITPSDLTASITVGLLLVGLPIVIVVQWVVRSRKQLRSAHARENAPEAERGAHGSRQQASREQSRHDKAGAHRGMTSVTAMTLITILVAFAAVASVIAWTSGQDARRQASLANTNPSSYGPACDAYLDSVTTYEDALFDNFSYECQTEIMVSSARTAELRQEAERAAGRSRTAWIAAGVAGLLIAVVWLVYRRGSRQRDR